MTEDEALDLREFVQKRSPEAFSRLTRRHAGLVYAVCLRRLGRPEDAEEACQAVFLALAKKASSVRPERLASWLHGAALRATALVARTRARREHYEKEAARMSELPRPTEEASWEQIQPHLDAGIEALPSKLREAVVRFYLENRSRSEIARELGVPEGTVASRVNAGLERLRKWYAGLGVTATGAGFALLLSSQAQAAVPASLVASLPTLATGTAATAGASAVAQGVVKGLLVVKLKTVAAVVCVTALAATAGGLALHSAPTTSPPASPGGWTARSLPGTGRCVAPTGGSALRAAYNSSNGRIYFCGGWYVGQPYTDSGRNEVFSYSVAEDDWRLEYPYRGPAGEVQPSHPSHVAWTFDSKRNLFWMIPGRTQQPAERESKTEGATLITNRIMTFDPARRRWSVPEVKQPRIPCKFAQYDPVKDQIVTFVWDGADRLLSFVYDIAAATWIETRHWKDPSGKFIAEARLNDEFSALDVEGRTLWLIEPAKGQLYRYDLDERVLAYVGETPVRNSPPGGGWPYDSALPVWDPGNKVLLWPQIHSAGDALVTLYLFRPQTGAWERGPSSETPVVGNCAVFDPRQRALLVIGGSKNRTGQLFLYRP